MRNVIRNAGGRATDDAIRSLVISHKLLGTTERFVIHHTNCGIELFTDEIIAGPSRTTSRRPRSMDGNGSIRITRAATRRAISSSGTRSRIRNRASRRTCGASASIRSCPQCARLRLRLRCEDRSLERSGDGDGSRQSRSGVARQSGLFVRLIGRGGDFRIRNQASAR
jgi:hypothetical protein